MNRPIAAPLEETGRGQRGRKALFDSNDGAVER